MVFELPTFDLRVAKDCRISEVFGSFEGQAFNIVIIWLVADLLALIQQVTGIVYSVYGRHEQKVKLYMYLLHCHKHFLIHGTTEILGDILF